MFSLASLLLLAAPDAPAVTTLDPIAVFKQVCTRGEGKFPSGSMAQLRYDELPAGVRVLIDEKQPSVNYRFMGGGRPAFLSIIDQGTPDNPTHSRICRVAGTGINRIDAMAAASEGTSLPDRKRLAEFQRISAGGYVLRGWRSGSYMVLEARTLSETDKAGLSAYFQATLGCARLRSPRAQQLCIKRFKEGR